MHCAYLQRYHPCKGTSHGRCIASKHVPICSFTTHDRELHMVGALHLSAALPRIYTWLNYFQICSTIFLFLSQMSLFFYSWHISVECVQSSSITISSFQSSETVSETSRLKKHSGNKNKKQNSQHILFLAVKGFILRPFLKAFVLRKVISVRTTFD